MERVVRKRVTRKSDGRPLAIETFARTEATNESPFRI